MGPSERAASPIGHTVLRKDTNMKDMKDIINVTWSCKQLRNKTISEMVASATKSFKLEPEEASLLEKVLIEFVTGISSPDDNAPYLGIGTALDYFEDACLSGDGRCTLGGKDDCSATAVKEVMRNYIVRVLG